MVVVGVAERLKMDPRAHGDDALRMLAEQATRASRIATKLQARREPSERGRGARRAPR
jgi:hypothetical protein